MLGIKWIWKWVILDWNLTFLVMTVKSTSNYTEELQEKITTKWKNFKNFRHTITYGISHLFCISFHCLAILCVLQNLVYCSHTWPLWVNFFLYTLCITMELKFMLYSMLLDIVYYKITIGQNHNVHFIERRRTNSII